MCFGSREKEESQYGAKPSDGKGYTTPNPGAMSNSYNDKKARRKRGNQNAAVVSAVASV
jgi:hypothetical protein